MQAQIWGEGVDEDVLWGEHKVLAPKSQLRRKSFSKLVKNAVLRRWWDGGRGRQVMSRVSSHPPSHPCTSLGGAGNRNWISPSSAFSSPKQDRYPPPSSMCSVFFLYCHIAPSDNTVLKIAQINFRPFLDLLAPKPLVLWSQDTVSKMSLIFEWATWPFVLWLCYWSTLIIRITLISL